MALSRGATSLADSSSLVCGTNTYPRGETGPVESEVGVDVAAVDGTELDAMDGVIDKELLGLAEGPVEGMELVAPDGWVDKEVPLGREESVVVGIKEEAVLGKAVGCVEAALRGSTVGSAVGREESVVVGRKEAAVLGTEVGCVEAALLESSVGCDVVGFFGTAGVEKDVLGRAVGGGCSVVVNFQASETPSTNSSSDTAAKKTSTAVPFSTLPEVTTYTCTVLE